MKYVLFCLLFCACLTSWGQQFIPLSGTVKDEKGLPVPGAGVYVSGYKAAAVTDVDGKFSINSLGPGNYDLLIQMVGFIPGKASVSLEKNNVFVKIVLKGSTVNINEVVIRPDADRDRWIRIFKDHFIGTTSNGLACKFLNPQVLDINFDKKAQILTVSASEFLIIENPTLGYKLKYLLKAFTYNYTTKIVYHEGYPNFEEMAGSKSKQKRWVAARKIAYNGSLLHFYRSLYLGTASSEGFIINKMADILNGDRKPDSLINAKIKQLTSGRAGVVKVIQMDGSDSLSYWMREKNKPKIFSVLNRAKVQVDTLVHTYNENLKYMNYKDDLLVMYTKEQEDKNYRYSGYWQSRPMDIPNHQISRIQALKGPVLFYSKGEPADPTSTLYWGFWAYEKVGDLMPVDY